MKKIAFIHYPHGPSISRLETMPFSLSSVVSLAKIGWNIDLYLWEERGVNYHDLLPDTVTIKYFRDPKFGLYGQRARLRAMWLPSQFKWRNNYCCVFGVGQIGAYIANILAKSNRCPFIYFNDEFPSKWGNTRWLELERQAVKNAAMIVLPDPYRFHPLCQEIDISTKPYAFLPNIPTVKPPFKQINWHEKLGIAKDFIPFLNAGTLGDWAQVPEILSSLPYWHEKAVLILHSISRELAESYRRELSHLDITGRVFWSFDPLPEEELHSLISYCVGNFALYRDMGPNIKCTGFSSGKLMRSLICGSPVIASKGFLLSFVKDYQLGVLVNHPCEIPAAVEEIMHHREAYSNRCLEFCDTHVSFEKAWQKFCEQFEQVVKIDLRQPIG